MNFDTPRTIVQDRGFSKVREFSQSLIYELNSLKAIYLYGIQFEEYQSHFMRRSAFHC